MLCDERLRDQRIRDQRVRDTSSTRSVAALRKKLAPQAAASGVFRAYPACRFFAIFTNLVESLYNIPDLSGFS